MMKKIETKVKEVIQRTHNVKSFRLDAGEEIDFKAGQFLCVTLNIGESCKADKYLSISSSPTEKGYIEFTKKISQSDYSKALDHLKPGDPVIVQYPMGNFTLREGFTKIAFLSGGIGITPIRSMCKYAVDTNSGVDIILIYANRSVNDIVFKEDFDQMQKQYSVLKVHHVLCEPAPDFKCTPGYINAQVIMNEIPDYRERKFYLCGPPAMVEAMKKILESELKVSQENIITENFQGY